MYGLDITNPEIKRAYQWGFNEGLHCAVENALEFEFITDEEAEELLTEEVKIKGETENE